MDQKPVVEEMEKIRESAAQLKVLLQEELSGNPVAGAVLEELMGTISRASSLLDSKEAVAGVRGLDAGVLSSPPCGEQGSESSSKKRKINPARDRRGGCRRRSQQHPLKIIKSKTLNDGQTWRKYGQKDIQSTKHPRSYFRCTHKFDQGCVAMKQVQLSEDDPSTYVITYMGEHTCKDPSMVPQLFSVSNAMDTCLISFAPVPADPFPSRKQESADEEGQSNLTTASSSSDYYVMPAAEEPAMMTPATAGGHISDHGDVTSGFQSTAVDMYFMSDQYLDALRFDNEFFFS